MSSFIGHSLIALTIHTASPSTPQPPTPKSFVWLGWLVLIALAPDMDYVIPWLQAENHEGLRISHALFSSQLLPLMTIGLLRWQGIRSHQLMQLSLQVVTVGLSHLLLDLLVGVTPLPLLWPWISIPIQLPFGILPSAGRLQWHNYFFYRNLLIELGVLLPVCITLSRKSRRFLALSRLGSLLGLWAISACFMGWAYTLSR